MSGGPQPGWYDDGSGALRWWDGAAWTAHRAPATMPPPGTSGRRRRAWPWVVTGCAVLLVVASVAAALFLPRHIASTAAADAVRDYDRACVEMDCLLYESVTTQGYRDLTIADCPAFAAEAAAQQTAQYDTDISSTTVASESATVTTRESWIDAGSIVEATYRYTLIDGDEGWRIDDREELDRTVRE